MTTRAFGTITNSQRTILWAAALPFLALLLFLLLRATHIGFASDDFVHLVEDAHRPWYDSSDHLNRPFRNALFRILPAFFDLNPLPYRLLAFLFYGVTAFLFYRLIRQLGFRAGSALAVTALLAFFPRNYEDLVWFAAFQDLIVSSCVLLACGVWLSYLRTRNLGLFAAAHVTYVLALGFKETAIGLPLVLFCLELFDSANSWSWAGLLRSIRKYLLFAAILAVFAGYVLIAGSAASSFHSTKGTYVGTSLVGIIPPMLRTLVNLILQFSPALTLRELTPLRAVLVLAGCALVALAIFAAANRRIGFFSLCWFLVFTLPTAAFARSVNADRYLMLPYMALLFLFAGVLDRFSPLTRRQAVLLWLGLLVYALAGSQRLVHYFDAFGSAAGEIDVVSSDALQLMHAAAPAPNAELLLVNLTHTREVNVLNNGVKGALMEKGMSPQVEVVYNFAQADAKQQLLLQSLQSCAPGQDPAPHAEVLLFWHGRLMDVSGKCSADVIRQDRHDRPDAWIANPPESSALVK